MGPPAKREELRSSPRAIQSPFWPAELAFPGFPEPGFAGRAAPAAAAGGRYQIGEV